MSYIALVHDGRLANPEFSPYVDWCPCGWDATLGELRQAYRSALLERGVAPGEAARRAGLVAGAVLLLDAQFAVMGYADRPAGPADRKRAWKLALRVQQGQLGKRVGPGARRSPRPSGRLAEVQDQVERYRRSRG